MPPIMSRIRHAQARHVEIMGLSCSSSFLVVFSPLFFLFFVSRRTPNWLTGFPFDFPLKRLAKGGSLQKRQWLSTLSGSGFSGNPKGSQPFFGGYPTF